MAKINLPTSIPSPNQEPSVKEKTLGSFKELVEEVIEGNFSNYVWRGVASSKYNLIPSALRIEKIDHLFLLAHNCRTYQYDGFNTEVAQIRTELELIKTFLRTADRRGLVIPKIETINTITKADFDWVFYNPEKWIGSELIEVAGLAQHYGVPTRLLDWTFELFTALYFASIEAIKMDSSLKEEDYLVIWGLDVNPIITGKHKVRNLKLVKPPYFGNPNLNAQAGLFTLWEINYCGVNEVFNSKLTDRRPLDELIKESKLYGHILTKYKIPISERFRIYHFLAKINWDASKIFPGYDGVKRTMEEHTLTNDLMNRKGIRNSFRFP